MLRKNFITREWIQQPEWGTKTPKELRAFMGGKIVEIEDVIAILNNLSISWSETDIAEQTTSLENETVKEVSFDQVKLENHSIKQADNQTTLERGDFTKWEIKINLKEVLTRYLFSQLKKARSFQNVNRTMTTSGVDNFILDYINLNILPRIKFKKIDLFVSYHDISRASRTDLEAKAYNSLFKTSAKNSTTLAKQWTINTDYKSGDLVQKDSTLYQAVRAHRSSSNQDENLLTTKNWETYSTRQNNILISLDTRSEWATITYKQIKTSRQYRFDYYFDLYWEKA